MPKLNDSNLMQFAGDLTKLAIENHMFSFYADTPVEERARAIAAFYKTLLESLNPEIDN